MDHLICSTQEDHDVSCKVFKTPKNSLKVEVYWDQAPCAGYKIQINDVIISGQEIKIFYEKIYPEVDSLYCQVIRNVKDSREVKLEKDEKDYTVTLIDR